MAENEKPVWAKVGFKQSVDDLYRYGPSARVGIGAQGTDKPVIMALAQIDTGAANTGISPSLALQLGLKPIGTGVIHEAGREPVTAHIFTVRLFLPSMDIDLDIAGLPSLAKPHDILIGRDALSRARLVVDFTNGTTQIHFKVPP